MIFRIYERYWKLWTFVPLIMLFVSAAILANNILSSGFILQRDVELSGGKLINVEIAAVDMAALQKQLPDATIHLTQGATSSLRVQVPFDADEGEVMEKLAGAATIIGTPTIRSVGPVLGDLFWRQTQIALITAFALMAIFVFILFRNPVASSIVLMAATADILTTMAILSVLNVKLSLAVLGALLMIIGYSVDTNILLTSSLLKAKKEEIPEKLKASIKTGVTMLMTIMAALLAIFFVSGSFVLEQIALVLIVGTLMDIPTTWLGNAGWLRLWLMRK